MGDGLYYTLGMSFPLHAKLISILAVLYAKSPPSLRLVLLPYYSWDNPLRVARALPPQVSGDSYRTFPCDAIPYLSCRSVPSCASHPFRPFVLASVDKNLSNGYGCQEMDSSGGSRRPVTTSTKGHAPFLQIRGIDLGFGGDNRMMRDTIGLRCVFR